MTTRKLVYEILMNDRKARNDDDYLYVRVIESCNDAINSMTVKQYFMSKRRFGIPPYETVRRARANLQKKYPSLDAEGIELVKRQCKRK